MSNNGVSKGLPNLANKINLLCAKIARLGKRVSKNPDGTINVGSPSEPVSTIFLASRIVTQQDDLIIEDSSGSTFLRVASNTGAGSNPSAMQLGNTDAPVTKTYIQGNTFIPNETLVKRDANGNFIWALKQNGDLYTKGSIFNNASASDAGVPDVVPP